MIYNGQVLNLNYVFFFTFRFLCTPQKKNENQRKCFSKRVCFFQWCVEKIESDRFFACVVSWINVELFVRIFQCNFCMGWIVLYFSIWSKRLMEIKKTLAPIWVIFFCFHKCQEKERKIEKTLRQSRKTFST